MLLRTLRKRPPDNAAPGIAGAARVGEAAGEVASRLRPGEIAVIDHIDLDRQGAQALLDAGAAAVVNAAAGSSGRYPNLGPGTLVDAGMPLVDQVGRDLLARVASGDRIRVHQGVLHCGEERIGVGIEQTPATVAEAQERSHVGMVTQLEAVAAGAIEHLRTEHDLFLEGAGIPAIRTNLSGRHAVVVTGCPRAHEELRRLRPYLRDHRPALVGVEAGADVLLAAGRRPDVIVGRLDTVSEHALRCGAELVAHTDRYGNDPAAERLERLGLSAVRFPAMAKPEGIALLLARSAGAELVVAVGSPTTLLEFLDSGRTGMASMFLTRMVLTGRVVDGRGVARLRRRSAPGWPVALLLVASIVALLAAVAVTPAGAGWLDPNGIRLDGFVEWVRGLVP